MHLDTLLTRSRHALKRERNRGLRGDDIDLILAYAELVRPAGNGCEICTLGRRGYQDMKTDGVPTQRADRLRRFAVVLSMEGSTIVTVFPITRDLFRRPYSRSARCWRS